MTSRHWRRGVVCLALFALAARGHAEDRKSPPREPSVAQVVQMALRAAKQSDPERTRALARRARLSGLVPELKVAATRGLQQDISATLGATTSKASQGDDLQLVASVSFDLPRLVFASDEVRITSVERWLAQDRRKIVEEVVRLYFKRRRLLKQRAEATEPEELEIALAETEALLDVLTDGAFSEALAQSPPPPPEGRPPL